MAKNKTKIRQVAALPYRLSGGACEVVLVTTRTSGRWILPKGWPIKGLSNAQAAAIEALEEAGLVGRPGRQPVGSYAYVKRIDGRSVGIAVDVYPLEIVEQRPKWREKGEREVRFFDAAEAVEKVSDPAIASLISRFVAGLLDEAPVDPRRDG